MYSTCLYCTHNLGTNEVLETLPIGRRIVFDSDKGRLWVVCRSCAKWNLVPFDTRLETINDCERIFRDTRTRFSTEHIGLARVREGLDLVRIGAPQLPEFASWRYGAQYRRRRRQTLAVASAGAVAGVAFLVGVRSIGVFTAGIVSGMWWQVPSAAWNAARNARRRVKVLSPELRRVITLKAPQIASAHIELSEAELTVQFSRPWGHDVVSVADDQARPLARRFVAALNDTVGSSAHLSDAISRLESTAMVPWLHRSAAVAVTGKPVKKDWFSDKARLPERWEGFGNKALRLASLEPSDRLAVEMWLSEEDEAKALAGELALLERQWKEAEELARIADALAIPDEVNQRFSAGA